ncbi:MAG: hypothetical protein MZW92_81375 [Comamonadaceae bacterium]|nr:hypothetical protein [Comamonadaceae bacterium]
MRRRARCRGRRPLPSKRWRERRQYDRAAACPSSCRSLNEAARHRRHARTALATAVRDWSSELIVVDGGSRDGTAGAGRAAGRSGASAAPRGRARADERRRGSRPRRRAAVPARRQPCCPRTPTR